MQNITGSYLPQSLINTERTACFNLETLFAGIYSKVPTQSFPHHFTKAEALYGQPIMSKEIVVTPTDGVRLIYTIAFKISPMQGFSANGVWNHVLPMADDLVL